MRFKIWFYAILFGMLFTITSYAISYPSPEHLFRYIIITIGYFSAYNFFLKKFNTNPKWLIIILCTATTVIDSSTLFTNPVLIPLRFPFATLFPFFGTSLAYIYSYKRRSLFCLGLFCLSFFFYFSQVYLIPKICYYVISKEEKINQKESFFYSKYLTIQNDTVELISLIPRCTLVDFYFVGCTPCEEKYKMLKEINDKVQSKDFKIILVCDGKITAFEDFKKHAKKNEYSNIIFLYDYNKVIERKFSGMRYPYEIIYNNKIVVSYYKGYSQEIDNEYINNNIEIIKNILKGK